MREERYHIALDKYDKNIVINALNTLRTRQLQEERPTEPVDELISKVAHAPAPIPDLIDKKECDKIERKRRVWNERTKT